MRERQSGSFRDPSGFLFRESGVLYRQVNESYREDYDLLMGSGLYDRLVEDGALVAHEEMDPPSAPDRSTATPSAVAPGGKAYRILRPEPIDFISYPYEWSFSQLRDAALHTLSIQQTALEHDMWLKDASAYNIQWAAGGRPVLIDTLSFERYPEGRPWVAYRQFCQHFLAPLALMHHRDVRIGLMSRLFIDGVPLDLASELLPRRSWLSFALATHVHLHARSQRRFADSDTDADRKTPELSRRSLQALLAHLESAIDDLTWEPEGTEWGDYYHATNYSDVSRDAKHEHVAACIEEVGPKSVWDLGGNVGVYSRLASSRGIPTVCFDVDPAAVEKNYRTVRDQAEDHLLPLVLDLTNPSPALGWANAERMSLAERGPADMVLALALVHHLAIGNNVPLPGVAEFFASLCEWLVVEFVPKSDSQVKRLLASREDIFGQYHVDGFRQAFGERFTIEREMPVQGSERTLFLMRRRTP